MLVANQPVIELGKLQFGKPYNFGYELTNLGDEAITITKIVVGCGSCTEASCDKRKLLPNEKTILKTKFTPGSKGIQLKKVTVLYDDENKQEKAVELKFKATVDG